MEPDKSKIIYSVAVSGDKEKMMLEDIPDSYWVEESDRTHSGIVIWGKYKDKWIMNPPCRDLVAHLIRTMT